MNTQHELVFNFIKAYMKIHGVAPSYSVIAKGIGLRSKANIHRIIHILKDEGKLSLKPHKVNSIKIIDRDVKEVLGL
jgi:SOS-response transcriptional repressor LexA